MFRLRPEDMPPLGDHPYPPQFPPMLDDLSVFSEIIYHLFIICMCLVIYFRTKEIYELTGHCGLHYFRNFFVFFALASVFRLFSFVTIFNYSMKTLNDAVFLDKICIFAMLFFGTVAFLSLAVSILARNHDIEGRERLMTDAVLYAGSAVIVLPFLAMRMEIVLIAILAVFFAAVMIYDLIREYNGNGRIITKNRVTNLLLFIFWVLNVQFYAKGLLPRGWLLPVMLLSAIIFFSIYLRLSRIYRIDRPSGDYGDSEITDEDFEDSDDSEDSDISDENDIPDENNIRDESDEHGDSQNPDESEKSPDSDGNTDCNADCDAGIGENRS